MAKVYIANTTFLTDYEGIPVTVDGGVTLVEEGHPFLERYPQWFTPVEQVVHHAAPKKEK